MPRKNAYCFALCIAVIGVVATLGAACSSPDDDPPPAVPGTPDGTQPSEAPGWPLSPEALHDTLIMLDCSGDDRALVVRSARDGHVVGRQVLSLPEFAETAYGCGDSPFITRQVFSEDYGKIAMTQFDATSRAFRATVLDLGSGNLYSGAPGGGFDQAPHHSNPLFHPTTGDLWYIDVNSRRLVSRPATGVDPVDRGPAERDSFLFAPDGTVWPGDWRGISADGAAVNPSGSHAAVAYLDDTRLVAHGAGAGESPSLGDPYDKPLPGGPVEGGCIPQSWLDDHRLICVARDHDVISLVTFSADHSAIASPPRPLTPQTGRDNSNAVSSPDRSSVAFVSRQGDQFKLFGIDLAGTGTPTPREVAALPGRTTLLEWR
jgi:hypothetical protein